MTKECPTCGNDMIKDWCPYCMGKALYLDQKEGEVQDE